MPPTEHGGLSAARPRGDRRAEPARHAGRHRPCLARPPCCRPRELSRTPVVSTHSCIRALCDNPRNLDDEQLDALRDVGGVVQITAVPHFLRAGRKAEEVTVADYRRPHRLRGEADRHRACRHLIGFRRRRRVRRLARRRREPQHHRRTAARAATARARLGLLWGGNFLRVMRAAEQVARHDARRSRCPTATDGAGARPGHLEDGRGPAARAARRPRRCASASNSA